MGMGKNNNKKKGTMSYVVMFAYGRGPTHCNAHTLTKKNIKVGFKVTSIWPFNSKAMDNKTQRSKFYIATNINNHGSDQEEYTLDEETNCNQSQQWREEFATVELLHITKTLVH
jgi:hypothetical protein